MSESKPRAKAVKFVDVSGQASTPQWMPNDETPTSKQGDPASSVQTLRPPKLESPPASELMPTLESLLPEAPAKPAPAPTPSAKPCTSTAAEPSIPPPPGVPFAPKPDTLIEALSPRAEEVAISHIVEAISEFSQARQAQLVEAEGQLVELVSVICQRVLTHHVTVDPSVCHALVREGLSALGEADEVTVRLGTFFADSVSELQERLRDSGHHCVVNSDPSLGQFGCVIETDMGRVDESLERRLERLLNGSEPNAELPS